MITEWMERSPLRERLERELERKAEYNKRYRELHRVRLGIAKKLWARANRERKRELARLLVPEVTAEQRAACEKARYERRRENNRVYYYATREQRLAQKREYQARMSAERKKELDAYRRQWRSDNQGRTVSYWTRKKAKKLQSTPSWLSEKQQEEIKTWYETAQAMMRGAFPSVEPDIYEVDHIVPLQGRKVCGLHVGWNLQILTAEENREKNFYLPDAEHLICYAAPGYDGVRRKLLGTARRAA